MNDQQRDEDGIDSPPSHDGTGGWHEYEESAEEWVAFAPSGEWTSRETANEIAKHEARLHELKGEIADLHETLQLRTSQYLDLVRREYETHVASQLSSMREHVDASIESLQTHCVEAVLDVAEVVCRASFASDNELVREQVRLQLAERNKIPLSVKVGAEDSGNPSCPLVAEIGGEESRVAIEVSDTLSPGDMVIEYEEGTIDFTLRTVLKMLRPALEQHLQSLSLEVDEEPSLTSGAEAAEESGD